MKSLLASGPGPLNVLAIGAHCDDVEIGAGGTLLRLVRERPQTQVTVLIATSTQERAAEATSAIAALVAPVIPDVSVHTLPDGRLPAHFDEVKNVLGAFASRPWDLVFAPNASDAHQDHAMLGSLVSTELRDHLTLHYEIPKWDGDLGRLDPNIYVALTADQVAQKWAVLEAHYPSQRGKDWWDETTFAALARLRGIECRSRYAEAFRMNKAELTFT